jgi:hypothetical protein
VSESRASQELDLRPNLVLRLIVYIAIVFDDRSDTAREEGCKNKPLTSGLTSIVPPVAHSQTRSLS